MREVDIIGYEGIYRIKENGVITRYAKKKKLRGGKFMDMPESRVGSGTNKRNYYPSVMLVKNGVQKGYYVHRLLAIHFKENNAPLLKREVNHKNGNIMDFRLQNLEWCTRAENCIHSKRQNRKPMSVKKAVKIRASQLSKDFHIEINDGDVKALKKLAVDEDKSFSQWITDTLHLIAANSSMIDIANRKFYSKPKPSKP